MCIRDSPDAYNSPDHQPRNPTSLHKTLDRLDQIRDRVGACLLYTSDAADERSSVDLGGRRIIKNKKNKTKKNRKKIKKK